MTTFEVSSHWWCCELNRTRKGALLVDRLVWNVLPMGRGQRGGMLSKGGFALFTWGLSSVPGWFGSSISSPLLKPTLTLGKDVISGGETNLVWQSFRVNGAFKIAVKVNLARIHGTHEIKRVICSKSYYPRSVYIRKRKMRCCLMSLVTEYTSSPTF